MTGRSTRKRRSSATLRRPGWARHVDERDVGVVEHELGRGAGDADDVERRLGAEQMREPLAVEAVLGDDDQTEGRRRRERIFDAGTHDMPTRGRTLERRIGAPIHQNLLLSPPNLRPDRHKHDGPVGPGSSTALGGDRGVRWSAAYTASRGGRPTLSMGMGCAAAARRAQHLRLPCEFPRCSHAPIATIRGTAPARPRDARRPGRPDSAALRRRAARASTGRSRRSRASATSRPTSPRPWQPRPRPVGWAGCCCSDCPIARMSRDLPPGTTQAPCRPRSARSGPRRRDSRC